MLKKVLHLSFQMRTQKPPPEATTCSAFSGLIWSRDQGQRLSPLGSLISRQEDICIVLFKVWEQFPGVSSSITETWETLPSKATLELIVRSISSCEVKHVSIESWGDFKPEVMPRELSPQEGETSGLVSESWFGRSVWNFSGILSGLDSICALESPWFIGSPSLRETFSITPGNHGP